MKPCESKSEIGKRVEEAAVVWLLGGHIGRREVGRNFRLKAGELDLIMEEQGPNEGLELVFVEIRFRRRGGLQSPIESVGFKKQLRLAQVIRVFLAQYRGSAKTLRFDVLCWDGESWEHFPNIWMP